MANPESVEVTELDPGGGLTSDANSSCRPIVSTILKRISARRFTKEDRATPTTIAFDAQGVPVFKVAPIGPTLT